jgi:hypothetical protein
VQLGEFEGVVLHVDMFQGNRCEVDKKVRKSEVLEVNPNGRGWRIASCAAAGEHFRARRTVWGSWQHSRGGERAA